jgi:predicted nucleic acid-binding protein
MDVATDTCIAINLLRVGRLDILGALPDYSFHMPAEVIAEIEDPDQQQIIREAVRQGWIREAKLEDPAELQTFALANAQLGRGESACIALAETRGWILATDDSKGAKWKKVISAPGIQLLNTPGIILLAIRKGVLTVQQADEIKDALEKNKFKMGFNSFEDLV